MSNITEQCKICKGFYRLDDNKRLPPHTSISTGEPCRGRNPKAQEYPVGFDSDLGVMSGGLPTLGKRR